MANEQVNSLFDEEAINKQVAKVISMLDGVTAKISAMHDANEGSKSAKTMTDFAAATEKTTKAANEAAVATTKLKDEEEKLITQIVEAAKAAKESSNAFVAFSNSSKENVKTILLQESALKNLKEATKALDKEIVKEGANTDKLTAQKVALKEQELQLGAALRESKRLFALQTKEMNAQEGSIDSLQAQYDQLFAVLRGTDSGTQEFKDLSVELEETANKINQLRQAGGDFSKNVGRYAGSFKDAFSVLEQQLTEVTSKLSSMSEGDAGFAELQEQQGLLLQLTKGLNKEYSSTKGELKALTEAAQQLSLAWGQNNENVQKFIQEVGQVKDDLGDVQDSIKLAASDTKGFDNLINAAEGVAGGFAVAEGAAALFGGENEELQKTFTKLAAITTILNGLQAIQNELKRKDSIFTGVQIAAQKAYTIAVGTSTGAMKALRLAISATGIGALILGISLLLPKIQEWLGSTEDNTKAQEDFNEALTKQKELLDDDLKGIELSTKMRVARAKIAGKSEQDIAKIESESNESRIEAMDRYIAGLKNEVDAIQVTGEESLKAKKEANKALLQAQKDRDNEILKQDGDSLDKQAKAAEDARKKQEDASKKAAEKQKEIRLKNAQAEFEIEKLKLGQSAYFNEQAANNEENNLLIRLDASKRFYADQLALIDLDKRQQLSAEGLTAKEKEKIKLDAQIKGIQAENEYLQKISKLNADAAAKQKEDAIKAAEDKENARLAKISDFEKAAQNRALVDADRLNKQLIALNNDYLAGTLTSYEEYEQKKKDIIEKGSITAIKNQIRIAEELLSKSLLSGDERMAKEKELHDLQKQLTDAQIEQEKIATDKSLANQEKRRQKLQETLGAINTGVGNITQAIDTITSIGYEKNKARLEEERTAIEEKYAREVENIKNSTLSQQDQAAELKKIEADKQVQIEANERRRRQIELERAKFQRLASIAGIITGTAQAVVTALASSPPPLNLILAATVGALGVAQLAKAVATPLPKYAKGTDYHKGGLAVVGDGGKNELVIDPSGKMFVTPATDTIMNLPKGSKVLPDINDINAAMLNSMMKSTAGLFTPKTANDSSRENTIWLANQFAKSMAKNKPNVKVNTNVNIGREIYLYKNIFE